MRVWYDRAVRSMGETSRPTSFGKREGAAAAPPGRGELVDFGTRLRERQTQVAEHETTADDAAELFADCDRQIQAAEMAIMKLVTIRDAKAELAKTWEENTPEETERARAELSASVELLNQRIDQALQVRLNFLELRKRMEAQMVEAMRGTRKLRGPRRGAGGGQVLEFPGARSSTGEEETTPAA